MMPGAMVPPIWLDEPGPLGPGPVQSLQAGKSSGATVVVGWAPTPSPPARCHGHRRRSDKEASMVVSWTVVSWIRHAVVGLALVVLALLGIEVTLFLVAATFSY